MTTQAVSAIENLANTAIRTVESYNTANKTLVGAYRTGVQRLLNGATTRYGAYLEQAKLPVLNEQIRTQMIDAQKKFNGFLIQRAEADTKNVIAVIDRIAVASTSGIDAATSRLEKIDSPAAQAFINGVSKLQLPIAQLSAQVAEQYVAGAKRVEARVNGQEEVAAETRPARRVRKAD
jgi:hypothetical protein